ncbi:MAG TPA: hypothetical protein DCM45_03600 [Clostridiales bacterium]|nr:hypothetical protein [Clostridiales bacterium]
MDFLEGFLMGPVWSDTEYETRRHIGFFWLIGWLFLTVFAYFLIYPEKAPAWLAMPTYLPYIFFFFLAFLTPMICRYYYRLNIALKIPILLLLALKFVFGFLAFLHFWQSRITVDLSTLPQNALEYINTVIARSTDYFSGLGDGTSMLVGIIAGGLLIVLTFAGGLLASTVLPALYLVLMKIIQRGIDLLARATLFREID